MKNEKMDWNKNAMDYETTDQYLYKDIRNKKIDGLFTNNKGVEKMFQTKPKQDRDMVNHPPHYNQYGIECIDAIQACTGKGFQSYLQGNILKYLWRYDYKNGVEDLKKAQWYLNKLIGIKDGNNSS